METDNEICWNAHEDVGAVCRFLSKAADHNPYSRNMKFYEYPDLGMELAGTHDLGAFGKLYDLIKCPESSNENGTA